MSERERCWLTHWRREGWPLCPLCGKPITWEKTIEGWTPCDNDPALCVTGGKWQVVKRRELTEKKYRLWGPGSAEQPIYAMIPHYYTCKVLRAERRSYALRNRVG